MQAKGTGKQAAARIAKKRVPRRRTTTKGALIKGMPRHLPSEILDNPIFRKKLHPLQAAATPRLEPVAGVGEIGVAIRAFCHRPDRYCSIIPTLRIIHY